MNGDVRMHHAKGTRESSNTIKDTSRSITRYMGTSVSSLHKESIDRDSLIIDIQCHVSSCNLDCFIFCFRFLVKIHYPWWNTRC